MTILNRILLTIRPPVVPTAYSVKFKAAIELLVNDLVQGSTP